MNASNLNASQKKEREKFAMWFLIFCRTMKTYGKRQNKDDVEERNFYEKLTQRKQIIQSKINALIL